MPEIPPYPGTPRWVKISSAVVGLLVVMFVAMMFAGGGHGPGRHMSAGDGGGRHAPAADVRR